MIIIYFKPGFKSFINILPLGKKSLLNTKQSYTIYIDRVLARFPAFVLAGFYRFILRKRRLL